MAYTYPGTLAVTRIIINHLDFLHNAYREKEGSKRLKKAYVIKVCFSMKNTFTANAKFKTSKAIVYNDQPLGKTVRGKIGGVYGSLVSMFSNFFPWLPRSGPWLSRRGPLVPRFRLRWLGWFR